MFRGNPLSGLMGMTRQMGINPMVAIANIIGQGNPMLGQIAQFATQYQGKDANEMKQLVIEEIQKAGGISQQQLDGIVAAAHKFSVSDAQIRETTALIDQHPELLKK